MLVLLVLMLVVLVQVLVLVLVVLVLVLVVVVLVLLASRYTCLLPLLLPPPRALALVCRARPRAPARRPLGGRSRRRTCA